MKKFKCTVTKETTMEIELDENVWTDEQIKNWSSYFYDANDIQDVAEVLAKMKSERDNGEFIEGFGIPLIDGKKPYSYIKDEDVTANINILNQEVNIDVDSDEI